MAAPGPPAWVPPVVAGPWNGSTSRSMATRCWWWATAYGRCLRARGGGVRGTAVATWAPVERLALHRGRLFPHGCGPWLDGGRSGRLRGPRRAPGSRRSPACRRVAWRSLGRGRHRRGCGAVPLRLPGWLAPRDPCGGPGGSSRRGASPIRESLGDGPGPGRGRLNPRHPRDGGCWGGARRPPGGALVRASDSARIRPGGSGRSTCSALPAWTSSRAAARAHAPSDPAVGEWDQRAAPGPGGTRAGTRESRAAPGTSSLRLPRPACAPAAGRDARGRRADPGPDLGQQLRGRVWRRDPLRGAPAGSARRAAHLGCQLTCRSGRSAAEGRGRSAGATAGRVAGDRWSTGWTDVTPPGD